jgi:inosine-uridine nucleoside N-ribohydrolase
MPEQLATTPCRPPEAHAAAAFARGTERPVRVIFDTDFSPDVDDVGALAILHALADQGEAEILGVVISSGDRYAVGAVSAVNTYYGRPNLPIGVTRQPTVTTDSPYTRALALDFPHPLAAENAPAVPEAVNIYRQLLAAQPDRSVTIISVGFLNNMKDLLHSAPDAVSERSGVELVNAKVARVVMMGGHYPDSASHPAGAEYNFQMDGASTYAVIEEWPTPVVFSGFELGVDIITGAALQEQTPPDHPVRVAYKLYTGGAGRNSWDLVTVHYAVRGSAGGYQLCAGGSNEVTREGQNRWNTSATSRPHAYLIASVAKETIEKEIEALLVQPPQRISR